MTAGVVRLGDTVRRPISADRSQVHDLLRYLEQCRFDAVPRFLGIDEHDREVLSFLPGEVPRDLGHFDDAQLTAAARLLRRFHDATAGFDGVRKQGAEVMCHNDWGPPNAVLPHGLPCGIIDFDTIAPGLRLWDLGYSAFSWLDLGNADYTGKEQLRRLFVFADGYDHPGCPAAQIAVHAVARQTALASWANIKGETDMWHWAASSASWTVLNIAEILTPTGYASGNTLDLPPRRPTPSPGSPRAK